MRPLLLATTLLAVEFIYIIIRYDTRPIRIDRLDRAEAPLTLNPESDHELLFKNLDGSFANGDSTTWNVGSEYSLEAASKAQSSKMQILTTVPSLQHHIDRNPVNSPPTGGSPQLFGWTPESYPDPLFDMIRCSLSFLPDLALSTMHDLRLCDPDWVLGINYLQEIAEALHNFTDIFTNQWDVGVVGGSHRALSEEQRRPQVRRALSSNDLGQFASPIQDSASAVVQKLFFHTKQWTADMTTGQTNHNPVPEVSLAVAIVRKVRSCVILVVYLSIPTFVGLMYVPCR
jgi:hypothetical protein